MESTKNVEGDIAEVGAYEGGHVYGALSYSAATDTNKKPTWKRTHQK